MAQAGMGGGTTAGSGMGGESGGSSPGAPEEPVQPIQRAGRYVLEFADIIFECDPALGARVTAFSLDGYNFLTGPEIDADNHGSTFWPSPQSDWGWPPPEQLDRAPFQAAVNGAAIELVGQPSAQLGLRFSKRFSADPAKGAVVLQYSIENTGASSRSVAPWEVSRVHPNGLTFFPAGQARPGSGSFSPLQTLDAAGATWFAHDPASLSGDGKLFADSSRGWLAHLAGDALFIKSFPDVGAAEQAPGEAEIEIYASRAYVEVEQQGPYAPLASGETASWTVRWYARKLPAGLDASPGSQALLDLVEQTIAGGG